MHLEALRRELAGRGWITSLLEPPGRPSSLFVQNPDPGAAALSDHILVDTGGRGQLLVLVALGHPHRPGRDAALAADRIVSVLRASDSGPVPSA